MLFCTIQVKYEDGDEEDLILSNEKIKFYISQEEMNCLKLSFNVNNVDNDGYDYDEMVVLAASLDDCQELEPGDIIWAKLTGMLYIHLFLFSFIVVFFTERKLERKRDHIFLI